MACFQLRARDHLALADQFAGHFAVFQVVQAVIQLVIARRHAGDHLVGGRAGLIDPQLLAGDIDRFFRHQTAGRQLAADHRDQSAHAVRSA